MHQFVFTAEHQLYYSTEKPVPIPDVVEALLGIERLIKLSPRAFEKLIGVEIDSVDVYVDQLESGSLLTKLVIKLGFKTEEGLDAFLDGIREKVGEDRMRTIVIGAVIGVFLLTGMVLLAKAVDGNTTTINASNNTIINIGAGAVEMSPEEFRAVVESSIPDKKELAKATVNILKPARSDPQATIVFDDNEGLTIPASAIAATPTKVEFGQDERNEFIPKAEVLVRAINRDSLSTGWAVRIPARLDKRLRLVFADGVDPNEVALEERLFADVTLVSRYNPKTKKYNPDRVVLLRIVDEEE